MTTSTRVLKDRRPSSISEDVADLHLAKRARKCEDIDMDFDEGAAEQMLEGCSNGDSGYRYLEHPADVQVHAWGPDLAKAVAQAVTAMYGYMTELDKVEEQFTMYYSAKANDLQGL
ncbi:hypothetical protein ANCDUO_25659, partial [Ancylostoma duodenale]